MNPIELRQKYLASARRLVVKMGTQMLSTPDGRLDPAIFRSIAEQVVTLRQQGRQVTLVSSGAIGAGMAHLGLTSRPRDVGSLQAVAAVGQPQLMRMMRQAFEPHGLKVAQILLSRSDFDDRARFLNLRNCINELHRLGCVPIVNENDTVAVDEIRFGDNDTLAALVANAMGAQVLVLLSVVNGLLDNRGQTIDLVQDVAAAAGHIRQDKSKLGTGGMVTKHTAAGLMTRAGEVAVIANGREMSVLLRIFSGQPVGTLFAPGSVSDHEKLGGRKRWIGLTKRPAGTLTVDSGAANALLKKGTSLLATGITACRGEFRGGDVVAVHDPMGQAIAQGRSNYSSREIAVIMGKKSSQFAKLLGQASFDEVIHRDNLVLLGH